MPRLISVARGPRAHRPLEHRPTSHGTRARALRGADLVVVRDNSRRAFPQLHGQGSAAWSLHQVGSCGFEPSIIPRSTPVSSPRQESADRPRSTCACTAQCGLGCGAGQLATRSSPAPWPRLNRTATASTRRLWLRTVCDNAFDPRGARPARSSPCKESTDRPRNTRACTARCRLSCGVGQLATRSSPVRRPRRSRTATASG